MSNLKIDRLQLEIIIGNDQARKSLRALEDEARKLKKDLRKVPEGSDEWKRISTRLKDIQLQHDKIIEKLGIEKLTMRELTQRQRELNAIMRNMDPSTKEYKKLKVQLDAVRKRMAQLRGTTLRTNSALSRMANGFNKYSMMFASFAASITGIIFSFRKAIDVANDFNASVSNLSAMTGLTGEKLDWLTQKAKDFAGSTTEDGIRITQTAKEIVDAYILMGSKRPELLQNKEALAEITEKAIILASAQKMDLNQAVQAVAASINQFNLKAKDSTRIINAMAAGSLKGSAFVQDLTDSLKNVGTVANSSNMSLEQTIAMLEILAKKQLLGEEAGTQMRSALLRLKAAQLGYQSGTFNLADALDEMNQKMKEFHSQVDKDAYLMKVFGKRQITAGSIMLQNVEAYNKMTKAVTGTNIAMEQAAINTDNNQARLDAARARLNKITIALGEKLAPSLTFSTSAFAYLMKTTLAVINVFNKYRGIIITATSGIIAYTVATKIAAHWDRIHYAYLITKEAITKAYAFTTEVLTGKIRIATIAQKAWNFAQKNNPIGLIVGLLIAAGTALAVYTRQLSAAEKTQQELNKVNLTASKAIADDKVKLEILLKTAKNERISKEKRIAAIKKLNELSPKYLGNLKLETINTNDAKKATDLYIEALLKKARIEAAHQKLVEIQKKLIDLQVDPEKQFGFWQKAWIMTKNFGSVTKAATDEVGNLNLKETQLKETMKELYKIIMEGTEKQKKTKKQTKDIITTNKKAIETQNNLKTAITDSAKAILDLKAKRDALAPTNKQAIAYYNRQIKAAEKLNVQLKELLNYTGELYSLRTKSMKDAILSDDDVEAINANVETVQDSINTVLDNIANKTSEGDDQTQKGVLWKALGLGEDASLADKLGVVKDMVMNAWADINQIMANADARQLQQFQKTHDQRKAILDKQLNAGKISYEQYTAQVSQLDAALDKKKRKLAHDAAVRQKEMNLFNAITGTALAIVSALKADPPMDIILAAIVGAMGALQIGVIASTPVPQLASGNFAKVTGADDGKTYNARVVGPDHPSGLFSNPTYVPGFAMFGETPQPELVFNSADTQRILNTPALLNALNATLGVSQMAAGNAREIIHENNTVQTFTDPELLALMVEIRNYVKQKPEAVLVANEDYIRTHDQVKQEYDEFQKKVN